VRVAWVEGSSRDLGVGWTGRLDAGARRDCSRKRRGKGRQSSLSRTPFGMMGLVFCGGRAGGLADSPAARCIVPLRGNPRHRLKPMLPGTDFNWRRVGDLKFGHYIRPRIFIRGGGHWWGLAGRRGGLGRRRRQWQQLAGEGLLKRRLGGHWGRWQRVRRT
jgi:hypothetical protein